MTVFVNINLDSQQGIAMRSWQKELVFKNISASENKGYADTVEVWDFELVQLVTKKIVEPKKEIRYSLRYTMEREDNYLERDDFDRWVVSKVEENKPTLLVK